MVTFIDDDNMCGFQQTSFHRLHFVAETWRDDRNHGGNDVQDIRFVLPDANSLDQYDIVACCLQHESCCICGAREPALSAARRHASDVHVWIERMLLHPDAVSQQGPARDGTADID